MATCSGCKAAVPDSAKFCAHCGKPMGMGAEGVTATSWPVPPPASPHSASALPGAKNAGPHTPLSDVTSSGVDPTPPPFMKEAAKPAAKPADQGPTQKQSMWASRSSSEAWRFTPGQVLDGRYRVIAPLGKGGMGEVYRAEDLKLSQPVALKFLPPHASANPKSLERMFNEVRVARQVSHANVCRVHDIGEIEGQHYISMEYVDGEDLSSLLRRIGRLPGDRAVQLTREICAGVHAAHDRGVLHRDLKPANIMLDGSGRTKVMDFGLAGLAEELAAQRGRAGTPAYMSPEQASGLGVTVASDVYALGLILFEIFTGKPVFRPESYEDLKRLHEQPPPKPSTFVPDIDPKVEAVIVQALNRDPALRPPSALAISAALPGGNILAEALARGETPSPAAVAASGGKLGLTTGVAAGFLGAVVALITLGAVLNQRTTVLALDKPQKSPDALEYASQELLKRSGETISAADSARGFELSSQPARSTFWYRESPTPLEPRSVVGPVGPDDPTGTETGRRLVRLDSAGTLIEYRAARSDAPGTPATDASWLFEAAGLDRAGAVKAPPSEPPLPAGVEAWDVTEGEATTRVEVATDGARIVSFRVVPATPPPAAPPEEGSVLVIVLVSLVLYGAPIAVAVWNIRQSRTDLIGAARLAVAFAVAALLATIMSTHPIQTTDALLRWTPIAAGGALHAGLLVCVCYLAIEPLVRRTRPQTIVGWSRMLAGNWRDAVVGRELLTGAAVGAAWAVIAGIAGAVIAAVAGPDAPARAIDVGTLAGPLSAGAAVISLLSNSLLGALLLALVGAAVTPLARFTGGKQILLWPVQTLGAGIPLGAWLGASYGGAAGAEWVPLVFGLVGGLGASVLINRFGLLTLVAAMFSGGVLASFPLGTGLPAWTLPATAVALFVVGALGAYGFAASRARPAATRA